MKTIETLEDAQYFIDHFREIGSESTTLYNVHSWTYDRHLPGEDGSLVVDDMPVTITIDKQDQLTRYCYTEEVGRNVKALIPLSVQDIYNDRKYINYALTVQNMIK